MEKIWNMVHYARAEEILNFRYMECGDGHKSRDEKSNLRNYCFRALEPKSSSDNQEIKLKEEQERRDKDYAFGLTQIVAQLEAGKIR